MEHHENAIDAFIAEARMNEDYLAIIVSGSVARGVERPDSDVDLYLVVTAEAFAEAERTKRLSYVVRDGVGYEGGYLDIKLATCNYLDLAAERGDDPVRASFVGSRVAWSRIDDLAVRLQRITELPAGAWEPRMVSFMAQVSLYGGYFLPQAEKLSNEFLLHHAAVHLVGAASRALLALNHVLFSGPKYLTSLVADLPRKPDGFESAADAVLRAPSLRAGTEFKTLIETFYDWPLATDQALSTFVRDNELAWLNQTLPPEYA